MICAGYTFVFQGIEKISKSADAWAGAAGQANGCYRGAVGIPRRAKGSVASTVAANGAAG